MLKHALLFALVLLTGTWAGAQTSPQPGGDDSAVRITRLKTFYFVPLGHDGPPPGSWECVSFVNDAPRTANHVRFVFAYEDAGGKTVHADALDRRGKFSTGALIEGPSSSTEAATIPAAEKRLNCRRFGGYLDADGNLAVIAADKTRVGVRPRPRLRACATAGRTSSCATIRSSSPSPCRRSRSRTEPPSPRRSAATKSGRWRPFRYGANAASAACPSARPPSFGGTV